MWSSEPSLGPRRPEFLSRLFHLLSCDPEKVTPRPPSLASSSVPEGGEPKLGFLKTVLRVCVSEYSGSDSTPASRLLFGSDVGLQGGQEGRVSSPNTCREQRGGPGRAAALHSPLSPQLLGHGHGRPWSRGAGDGGSHPARPGPSSPLTSLQPRRVSAVVPGAAAGEAPPLFLEISSRRVPSSGSLVLASGSHFLFPASQLHCS